MCGQLGSLTRNSHVLALRYIQLQVILQNPGLQSANILLKKVVIRDILNPTIDENIISIQYHGGANVQGNLCYPVNIYNVLERQEAQTESWGTPEIICVETEFSPLTATRCDL